MKAKCSIVIGKSKYDRRKRRYMMVELDGKISYHCFKEKEHIVSTKYGNYGVIKVQGEVWYSYNIGAEYDIEVIENLGEITTSVGFFPKEDYYRKLPVNREFNF